MAGHSPLKTGVERPYVPAIHVFGRMKQDVDARHKAGHDDVTELFPAHAESGEVPPKGHLMLCDT
jgi:hypothetical protein